MFDGRGQLDKDKLSSTPIPHSPVSPRPSPLYVRTTMRNVAHQRHSRVAMRQLQLSRAFRMLSSCRTVSPTGHLNLPP